MAGGQYYTYRAEWLWYRVVSRTINNVLKATQMKENVRKYFMAGTDEEVQLGDVITQELVKDFKDGRKITREVEFKLTEDTLPYALEMGIIEADEPEEEENKDNLIDFNDEPCEELSDLIEDFEDVEQKVDGLMESTDMLRKKVLKLEEGVATLKELYRLLKPNKEEKPASPKKK